MTKFNLDSTAYTPAGITILKSASEKEARAEYSRLRSIARKRLERLAAAGFDKTAIYKFNKDRFITLKKVKSPQQLGALLGDVRRFLIQKSSTVKGAREVRAQAIERLRANNYNIQDDDFDNFVEFMEWWRAHAETSDVPSDIAVDIFKITERRLVNREVVERDFSWWVENVKTSDEDIETEKVSMDYIREVEKYFGGGLR